MNHELTFNAGMNCTTLLTQQGGAQCFTRLR